METSYSAERFSEVTPQHKRMSHPSHKPSDPREVDSREQERAPDTSAEVMDSL
jgi:hypothetical protein